MLFAYKIIGDTSNKCEICDTEEQASALRREGCFISPIAINWSEKRMPVFGVLEDIPKIEFQEPAPYVPTLDETKQQKLSELSFAAQRAYTAGFQSSASGLPMWYDSDADTQTVINRLYADAKYSPTLFAQTIYFTGVSAGVVPIRAKPSRDSPDSAKTVQYLNVSQIVQLGNDLAIAWSATKLQLWTLQGQVNSATTVDAVQTIQW